MEFIVVVAFSLIVLAFFILIARNYYVHRKLKEIINEKYHVVEPLLKKIRSRENITHQEILEMSQNPSLRYPVFKILEAHNKADLFPDEYYTVEKAAESMLVIWLEYPTELGFAPDQIQFETTIILTGAEPLVYYVFRFQVERPSWPTKDWMIGVCGPYEKSTQPYEVPARIFSRFNAVGSISLHDEVKWVHENVNQTFKGIFPGARSSKSSV